MDAVTKMADKWSSIIEDGGSGHSAIIDVNLWLGKATLDSIGIGAFDYDFGALDNSDNQLVKSYENVLIGSFGAPSRFLILLTSIVGKFPGLLFWLATNNSSNDPGIQNLRRNKEEAHRVARQLLESKRQELKAGAPRKDIMSLLVKSSDSQREDWRLTDEEVMAQVRSLMLAGHESTSKALTFALWELARHRDCQEKLRAEVNETLEKVKARGDVDFTTNDFESMPYLVAVTKETLRLHPIAVEVVRTPIQDDILPLTKPIVGTSGKVYNELPIPKGTVVSLSSFGYNLNQDVWGTDACAFRPERWFGLREQAESPVGVYGNLATFSGGVRGCLGWRFAIAEMQAFLVTLIRKFDIAPANHQPQIRRTRGPGLEFPFVLGEEHKGTQLPLKITLIRDAQMI